MLELDIHDTYKDLVLEPGYIVFLKEIKTESYAINMSKLLDYQIHKNWSYKVEAHIAITSLIYLTENYPIFVDFEQEKVFLCLLNKDTNREVECYIKFNSVISLYKILNFVSSHVIDHDEYEQSYDLYKDHTRLIFDNMDSFDNISHVSIWYMIIDQAKKYFG